MENKLSVPTRWILMSIIIVMEFIENNVRACVACASITLIYDSCGCCKLPSLGKSINAPLTRKSLICNTDVVDTGVFQLDVC